MIYVERGCIGRRRRKREPAIVGRPRNSATRVLGVGERGEVWFMSIG
jgi:hypothetical protein